MPQNQLFVTCCPNTLNPTDRSAGKPDSSHKAKQTCEDQKR